jgi:hypothetical protein
MSAEGYADKTSSNTVQVIGTDKSWDVNSAAEWTDVVSQINSGADNMNHTINLTADFDILGYTGYTLNRGKNLTLTIRSKQPDAIKTLGLSSAGRLISIWPTVSIGSTPTQKIILQNIKLKGYSSNTEPLIYIRVAELEMNEGTLVYDNRGYGVRLESSEFIMNGGEISGNTDGVYAVYSTFTMVNGKISGNNRRGVDFGGSGTFIMEDGEISGNSGGGIYFGGETFTMIDGIISGNTDTGTYGAGGGVYVGSGTFTMEDGEISGNTAGDGGGVYVSSGGTFTMEDGEISDNNFGSKGGGVYLDGGTFTMDNGIISGNTGTGTYGAGGGVYLDGGTFTMNDGIISGNIVTSSTSYVGWCYGGGVYVYSGTFTKASGTIYGTDNLATDNVVKNESNVTQTDRGSAVYVQSTPAKKRETTVTGALDSAQTGAPGGWTE